jgi:hypothetical protein
MDQIGKRIRYFWVFILNLFIAYYSEAVLQWEYHFKEFLVLEVF